MKLLIGADPEFFLSRPITKTSGMRKSWTSAHDIVPGSKRAPFKIEKGAIQADGTAVEFNIDAASTPEEFASNIRTVLETVRKMVPKEYLFEFTPSIIYGADYFKTIPESAKELGCDPDFDAWRDGEMNARPVPKEGHRTASGHLHLGWTSGADVSSAEHLNDCMLVVRRLDYYFSLVSGLWESEEDRIRRTLYGNWGCFRPKPYGVEYRVLGNSWLKYPNLWPWMFRYTEHAFRSLEKGFGEDQLPSRAHYDDSTGKVTPNLMGCVAGRGLPATTARISSVNRDIRSYLPFKDTVPQLELSYFS